MSKPEGGQPGNKNAAKGKSWADALRLELATFTDKDLKVSRGQALRAIAKRVVRSAIAGDKDAWKEIGDRLDGKAAQAITGADGGAVLVRLDAIDSAA
jgi:hypothetical protein